MTVCTLPEGMSSSASDAATATPATMPQPRPRRFMRPTRSSRSTCLPSVAAKSAGMAGAGAPMPSSDRARRASVASSNGSAQKTLQFSLLRGVGSGIEEGSEQPLYLVNIHSCHPL